MGIGIDITQISRFNEKLELIPKILSPLEIEIFNKRGDQLAFLAGRFAAKEAFLKANGVGLGKISLTEIEILALPSGQPILIYRGKEYSVSISHDGDYATAIVII